MCDLCSAAACPLLLGVCSGDVLAIVCLLSDCEALQLEGSTAIPRSRGYELNRLGSLFVTSSRAIRVSATAGYMLFRGRPLLPRPRDYPRRWGAVCIDNDERVGISKLLRVSMAFAAGKSTIRGIDRWEIVS